MGNNDFDAVVIGSGPNGLAAAITLQQAGKRVLVLEKQATVGGGMRSAELTLPGFVHDVCSAIHPMAVASPFFTALPLHEFGLEFIQPEIPLAHPFDGGTAIGLYPSIAQTAHQAQEDAQGYTRLMQSVTTSWPHIADNLLGPLSIPRHPLKLAGFGLKALQSAARFATKQFSTPEMRALFTGMAAHSMQPLHNSATAAFGLILAAVGHLKGWPIPKGGSKSIAFALEQYFLAIGGKIQTNAPVTTLSDLPTAEAILFDLTPKQILAICGDKFSDIYRRQMRGYKYGMGVYKVDWALDAPVPFTAPICHKAGTLHLGNSMQEIVASEQAAATGKITDRPFVLFSQQSRFDATRAPEGKHTAWAYCHVPHGSTHNMCAAIENQIERFAPGFKARILAKHVMNTVDFEQYNPNYVGGDINGGEQNIRQLFTRPVLSFSPYKTGAKGIYICSSSTPPGGGVHGMCGYHAARRVLKDVFGCRDSYHWLH